MGVDFNAKFAELNTNNVGESANVLDAEECRAANSIWTVSEGMTAEQFKEANQHCSEYDANEDGVVTVKEQKASIAGDLKKVWDSCIARFFKDDISYDDSSSREASSITSRVRARIQNCLNYIEYAKQNNIDIFKDNTGTGVDDEDGELQTYTDGNGGTSTTTAKPGVTSSVANSDGTVTDTYNDGDTITWNDNYLKMASTWKEGSWNISDTYDYNEDGSYTYNKTYDNGAVFHVANDQNNQEIGFYKVTARGNYKANALEGETMEQTLTRLGITDPVDIAAVKKANPKATRRGAFLTISGDVYIPKAVIANMQANGTFDQNKLMGKTV